MRASVCASTALVGSTSTSVSASESSARASTSRCRWPPENERPRSSTGASSPSGSGSSTSSALAIAIASQIRSSWPFAWPHGSSSWRSVPAKSTGSASLTTMRRRTVSTGRSARRTSPSTTPSSSPKRPSRSAIALVSAGSAETRQTSSPGWTTRLRARVGQRHAGGRLGRGRLGVVDVPLDREHVQHPARADERARDLVDRLRGGAQRDDEERGVAVERDQLAGLDLALRRRSARRAR